MKPKFSKILAGLIVLSIFVLTFLRENIFLEVNAIMDGYEYNSAYFYFFDKNIEKLTLTELFVLKWGLTIIFILLISGLSLLSIKLWFKNKKYNRITLFIYLSFYGLTALLTLVLWLSNYYDDYYFVIRKMAGFLQSPLPLFLFFSTYAYLVNVNNE